MRLSSEIWDVIAALDSRGILQSVAGIDVAGQLNFAPSTIVFTGDLPCERTELAFRAPEVRCYAVDQAQALLVLKLFWFRILPKRLDLFFVDLPYFLWLSRRYGVSIII